MHQLYGEIKVNMNESYRLHELMVHFIIIRQMLDHSSPEVHYSL